MDMTMCTQRDISTTPVLHSSVKTLQSYVKPAKKFKVKLSTEKNSTPINKVLAAAAAKGLIDDLDYRSTGTNSIDLLFPTMLEAETQHQKLISKLNDVNISKPDLNRGKKAFLVGLSDFHTVEYVQKAINDKYGNVLKLNDENKNCIEVLEINPCNRDKTVYRATLSLTHRGCTTHQ